MIIMRLKSIHGQRFFITSATITADREYAARTISSGSPPCNWVLGSSNIELNVALQVQMLETTVKEKPFLDSRLKTADCGLAQ